MVSGGTECGESGGVEVVSGGSGGGEWGTECGEWGEWRW